MTGYQAEQKFWRRPASVGQARSWLRAKLAEALPSEAPKDLIYDAESIFSEIVTNAVLHGCGMRFNVKLTITDDTMTLQALGGRRWRKKPPAIQDPTSEAEDGRGLLLVESISNGDWGHEENYRQVRVWVRLKIPGTAAFPNKLPSEKTVTEA